MAHMSGRAKFKGKKPKRMHIPGRVMPETGPISMDELRLKVTATTQKLVSAYGGVAVPSEFDLQKFVSAIVRATASDPKFARPAAGPKQMWQDLNAIIASLPPFPPKATAPAADDGLLKPCSSAWSMLGRVDPADELPDL